MNPDNIAHTGRLYRYKPELLHGGRWKESWAVLLTDSTFFWYNDKHCSDLRGRVTFRDIYDDVDVSDGVQERFGSKCIKPPLSLSPNWLFVVPTAAKLGSSRPKKDSLGSQYQLFCAKSEEDLGQWVSAFAAILRQEDQFDSLRKAVLATQNNTGPSDSHINYKRTGAPISGQKEAIGGRWGYVWDEIKNSLKAPGDLSARPSLISGSPDYRAILSKFSEEDVNSIERFVSVSQLSFAGAPSDASGGTPLQEQRGIELELISEESRSKRLVGGAKKTQRLFAGNTIDSNLLGAEDNAASSVLGHSEDNMETPRPGAQMSNNDGMLERVSDRSGMNIKVEAHVHEDGIHYATVNEPQTVTLTQVAIKKFHLDSIDSGIERDDSPTSSILSQQAQSVVTS